MTETYAVRKEPRTSVRCSFCYFCDGALGEGTVWDLSKSGWRANGSIAVTPGSELTVYLKLSDESGSGHIPVEGATVRWVEGLNMGWEITKIEDAARTRLDEFLARCEEQ